MAAVDADIQAMREANVAEPKIQAYIANVTAIDAIKKQESELAADSPIRQTLIEKRMKLEQESRALASGGGTSVNVVLPNGTEVAVSANNFDATIKELKPQISGGQVQIKAEGENAAAVNEEVGKIEAQKPEKPARRLAGRLAKPKKEVLEQVKQCTEYGAIHAKNAVECPQCGYSEKENETEIKISKEIAVLTDEIPLPNGSKIVDYCLRIGKDKNFGWLILQNQIIDLFIRHSVTFGTYQKSLINEKFEQSIRRIIKEPYQTIQGSNLESGTMRTKAWIINKIKTKLDKYYETKGRKESSAGMLALDKRSA